MTGGTAAILGPTGRNVGAGMSGGVGYVLDLEPSLVNTELVDICPLGGEDALALRAVLEQHAALTASTVASALLDDWPAAVQRFSALVPRDYRRVLEATRQAEAEGADVDEAVMAAARG
jgi:glutamate synthase (NADPH/NADH) large chain